jgi:hypothetical protein
MMSKLIISGKKSYTKRLYKHLRKEHPSTKHRMILRDKNYETDVRKARPIKGKCVMCGKNTIIDSYTKTCKPCFNHFFGF